MFPAFQNIGWLSVIIGAAFSFFMGMLWYGPLFGKTWVKLANIKMEKGEGMKNPGLTMISAVLASFLTALAIERFFVWSGTPLLHATIGVGIMAFFGFSGPKMLDGVLWGGQRWALFAFNAAYTLIVYTGIALIVFYV